MLAKAAAAVPLCCRRCQLRQVIFPTRNASSAQDVGAVNGRLTRAFTTSVSRCEGDAEDRPNTFLKSGKSDERRKERYRREYPLGRIVGQPGRKQRERSERLSINSMQQPFDVVVMQDVHIPQKPNEGALEILNEKLKDAAGQKAGRIPRHVEEQPTQEEVNVSIDELRPDTHVIDPQRYDRLVKQLVDAYNVQQLSAYLQKSVQLPSTPLNTSAQRSRWRPGRTPLEQRHNSSDKLVKGKPGRQKKALAEKILLSVWNLKQVGEMELSLKNWQMRYLFDLRGKDQPNYARIIQSPLLLRAVQIESHPTDNTVRITGRQTDAEQIAGLIERGLLSVGTIEFDLSVFAPMLSKQGWPLQLGTLFSDQDLGGIEQHTMTIIERRGGDKLNLYGRTDHNRQETKRLLLSLLHLPSPSSVKELKTDIQRVGEEAATSPVLVLENNVTSLPFQHRNHQLYRSASPHDKAARDDACRSDGGLADQQQSLATYLADELEKQQVSSRVAVSESLADRGLKRQIQDSSKTNGSYWDVSVSQSIQPWTAQLCKILRPSGKVLTIRKRKSSEKVCSEMQPPTSVVQSHFPGTKALLSYLLPKRTAYEWPERAPSLTAHFFPSPFTSKGVEPMQILPRIELRYDLVDLVRPGRTSASAGDLTIRLTSMTAILSEQDLHAPLPNEAADLRFVRKSLVNGNVKRAMQDSEITRFTQALRASLERGDATLAALSAVRIKLPAWVTGEAPSAYGDMDQVDDCKFEYLFERFEQIETADLVPLQPGKIHESADPEVKRLLESMPEIATLQYREIEGGIIGGSRTELILKNSATDEMHGFGRSGHLVATRQENCQLVEASLRLVRCLTEINTAQLPPLQRSLAADYMAT